MYIRKLSLEDENNDSVFLWGARQVGKTTLLEQIYPQARYYNLLLAKEFERFLRRPSLLSEELESMKEGDLVIIDEIQKIPQLLDEIAGSSYKCNKSTQGFIKYFCKLCETVTY